MQITEYYINFQGGLHPREDGSGALAVCVTTLSFKKRKANMAKY